MPTLHGAILSPFVRKVRAYLTLKGLPCDLNKKVMPGSTDPEYRKISPLGKIPAYTDGELALADSSVICAYLERVHPDPALYPADDLLYARALWLEEYADTLLAQTVGAKIFFPRAVTKGMMKREIDEARVQSVIDDELPPIFDYLDAQFLDVDFAVGNSLSIADLAIATHFVNLKHAGVEVDASRWPDLARFISSQHESSHFKAFIEQESAALSR